MRLRLGRHLLQVNSIAATNNRRTEVDTNRDPPRRKKTVIPLPHRRLDRLPALRSIALPNNRRADAAELGLGLAAQGLCCL
jgi:hypothetical protein